MLLEGAEFPCYKLEMVGARKRPNRWTKPVIKKFATRVLNLQYVMVYCGVKGSATRCCDKAKLMVGVGRSQVVEGDLQRGLPVLGIE